MPFRSYLTCFLLAVLVEGIALASFLPALAEQMMRHSGGASRTPMETVSEDVAFVLHLPTVLIMWPLTVMTDSVIVWLTPITQIIFWTVLFASIARRRRLAKA
jgi:peptidoglycan biosynthesis protein MviN/MurJ (putative lipid II flippase)